MTRFQAFPPLDSATEAALRRSIEQFGVIVPVVVDQHGEILDGHHRSRIAGELRVPFATDVREVADEAEAREIARTLNADRRHLSVEQRREVVVALREEGHSQRAIAGALGVSQSLVSKDLDQLSTRVQLPDRVVGLDGKSRPASQPKPDGRHKKPWLALDKPVDLSKGRHREIAERSKQTLIETLSPIKGSCKRLHELNLRFAFEVMTDAERQTWARIARQSATALNQLSRELQKGQASNA